MALQYQSERDPLTGLYNRATTEALITRALTEQEPNKSYIFIILDIDSFKQYNDTYGHPFGDRTLIEVAKKLRTVFRSDDIIGRIGGDEFVAFMPRVRSVELAESKVASLCDLFGQIELLQRAHIQITCSVGVSVFPADGGSFKQLYQNADIALYEAKKAGRDRYVFYRPQMHTQAADAEWLPYSNTKIDSDQEQ